jgi:hypothetical protein
MFMGSGPVAADVYAASLACGVAQCHTPFGTAFARHHMQRVRYLSHAQVRVDPAIPALVYSLTLLFSQLVVTIAPRPRSIVAIHSAQTCEFSVNKLN